MLKSQKVITTSSTRTQINSRADYSAWNRVDVLRSFLLDWCCWDVIDMACGKLVRSSLTHLCPSLLFIGNKTVSLGAVRHIVTSHPLVRVLPTLSSNAWHSSKPSHINLKPLPPVTPFSTPRPSKPPNAPLTESGVPRRAVVVVEWGRSYQLVRNTTVFQANRNITFAYKRKKKVNSWNIKFQPSNRSFAYQLNSFKSVSTGTTMILGEKAASK